MIVNRLGSGTSADPYRPDVPEGTDFRVVADLDGTYEVEYGAVLGGSLRDNASTVDAAITAALTRLQELVDAPAVDVPPSGTMTTAQLSNVVRQLRDAVQANRAGAQEVALTLKRTIRLVRGDYEGTD